MSIMSLRYGLWEKKNQRILFDTWASSSYSIGDVRDERHTVMFGSKQDSLMGISELFINKYPDRPSKKDDYADIEKGRWASR